jgi:eukaryotic-like serine/threonine-protein kinase
MNDTGRQWAGQIVDGKFELRDYLGASQHAYVYAAEREGQSVAIKLIRADRDQAGEHLLRWIRAANLEHPAVARMFETGCCCIGDTELAYVVMERADETLAEILPQRALTPMEVNDMLPPILDALEYLNGRGFAHARIKPANILAIGDDVKISSDAICVFGSAPRGAGEHDAPEVAHEGCSAAADVWSLGIIIVQALTKRVLRWNPSERYDPTVPPFVPQPFFDIARNCLRSDPRQRWNLSDISGRLRASSPALQGQHVQQEIGHKIKPPIQRTFHSQTIPASQPSAPPKWRRFAPAAALGALAASVILLAPKVWERYQHRNSGAAVVEAGPSLASRETPPPAAPNLSSRPSDSLADSSEAATPMPVKPQPTGAQGETQTEVTRRIMPEVPRSALDTIQGTVRVGIRVEVGPSGNVSGASIESPGPSKYFANAALKAAGDWKFAPAAPEEETANRTWILRFEFTRDGARATPTPVRQ